MIIRGTTPYHTFLLPLAAEDIQTVYVTYLQNEEVILEKTNLNSGDMEIVNIEGMYENASVEPLEDEEIVVEPTCQLTIHLSQEDTLKFHFYPAARKNTAVIQIRVLTTDGEAYASDPVRERIFGVLHEGVITDVE